MMAGNPPAPPKGRGAAGNALLDTGSSFLVLETGTWQALRSALARRDERLVERMDRSARALADGGTLAMHEVEGLDWPDLHFGFEAPDGATTEVRVPARTGGTVPGRSEERRVGKECVPRCRSRGSPYH